MRVHRVNERTTSKLAVDLRPGVQARNARAARAGRPPERSRRSAKPSRLPQDGVRLPAIKTSSGHSPGARCGLGAGHAIPVIADTLPPVALSDVRVVFAGATRRNGYIMLHKQEKCLCNHFRD